MSPATRMKCRVCREPAVIDLRRHNANFCHEHFVAHCEGTRKAVINRENTLALTDACLRARQSADEKRVVSFE